ALSIHALGHLQAQPALDERLEIAGQAVGMRTRAATQLEDVAEPACRDEAGPRTLSLKHRICSGSRTMNQPVDGLGWDAKLVNALQETTRAVVDRRRHLGGGESPRGRIQHQEVRECAAHIDTNANAHPVL